MSDNKTVPQTASVTDFISALDNEKRKSDSLELLEIMKAATGTRPIMWGSSIIGFGTYHYKYETGREGDTVAVGFSPRKNALVLYGVIYYEQNLEVSSNLGPHTTGKGCLYIKNLSLINEEVLADMVRTAFKSRNNS